jgi:hypothetical protein
MCTLSWLPGPGGYTVCFNRDERRTRAPALPPAVLERSGVRFIAPLDGEAGGTWVLVNEFGLSLGLLNRYQAGSAPPPGAVSRGTLVLELAPSGGGLEALAALERRDLRPFAPFTLAAVEPGEPARLAVWDGRRLACASHTTPGLVITSSAVDEGVVRAARTNAFLDRSPATAADLLELHRSHRPTAGSTSICMHRADAETRSCSLVEAGYREVQLTHFPDAPCRTEPLPSLTLARRVRLHAVTSDTTAH